MVDEKQVCDINRITAVMIYEMDIITSIAESDKTSYDSSDIVR